MRCPECELEQAPDNRFCEDCGTDLRARAAHHSAGGGGACPTCGAGPEAAETGFCGRCGHQRPAARDHLELAAAAHLAGVSDRGNCHHRNDDFLALAANEGGEALVVCDGVSSSQTPDRAAEVAASAACAVLLAALRRGPRPDALAPALREALKAADAAVRALPSDPSSSEDPPETTVVAALRRGGRLAVGWLGDSRAYLLTPTGARQLTEDHSWVNEVVAAGQMTTGEALSSPQAHCITRTLGGHGAGDEPSLQSFELPAGAGLVVLCSDGLWNYLSGPAHLQELVRGAPRPADALAVARALVGHALARRGHDNVTAAVLTFGHAADR